MKIKTIVGAAVALGLSAMAANAAVVTAAGTGSSGAGGFTLTGGSGVIADVVPHPAWVNSATTPTSNWVWDSAATSFEELTFSYSFDMTGFDVSTAALSGIWAVDNVGTAMLNGTAIATLGFLGSSFDQYNAFSAGNRVFNEGLNTLTFMVEDLGAPGGFRAAFEVTADVAPVPLPAGMSLLLVAIGGLGIAARRHKSS